MLHPVRDHEQKPTIADAMMQLAGAVAVNRQWMTAEQAAEFLGINHSEFKRLAAAGEIPRHSVQGRCYRYNAHELTNWLLSR